MLLICLCLLSLWLTRAWTSAKGAETWAHQNKQGRRQTQHFMFSAETVKKKKPVATSRRGEKQREWHFSKRVWQLVLLWALSIIISSSWLPLCWHCAQKHQAAQGWGLSEKESLSKKWTKKATAAATRSWLILPPIKHYRYYNWQHSGMVIQKSFKRMHVSIHPLSIPPFMLSYFMRTIMCMCRCVMMLNLTNTYHMSSS